MKVAKEKIEGSRVVLNIEIESEEMEKSLQDAYRHMVGRVVVPGFRKGKAPRAMLERYLGKDRIVEEALNHLIPDAYERALKDNQIDAIAQPELEIVQREPMIFKATVPVRPTIELGDYHQIKVTREEITVTEDEVNQAIEKLRERKAPWDPVERAAMLGDLVTIDVLATADGKTVIDDKAKWYQLTANSSAPTPGFAEALVGAAKGEVKEFTLALSDQFGDLAGKEGQFKVTVAKVEEKRLPEINDEFAKGLGVDKVETLDALRAKINDEIKAAKEQEQRTKLEEQVVNAVLGMATLEYPQVLVEHEIEHLAEERSRYFGGKERYLAYLRDINKSEEDLKNELRPMADERVKRSLVVSKVGDQEKIEVSDLEVDAEIERLVKGAGDKAEELRKVLTAHESRHSIESNLRIRKTLDLLVNTALGKTESTTKESEVANAKAATQ